MRTALAALLCLLAAIAVLTFRGEDPVPDLSETRPVDARSAGQQHASKGDGDAPDARRVVEPAAPFDAFVIPPGADVVRGRLLQKGTPVAAADISVAGEVVGRSAADGTFVIAAPADEAYLEVRGEGVPRGVSIGPIELHGMRDRDLGDLRVPSSVSVVGRVVDTQGHARANVRVYATNDRFIEGVADDDARADLNVSTRNDGAFRIDGLRAGEVRVRARADGYVSQRPSVSIANGVGDVGVVVLVERRDLVGVVVDERGQPIAGASVTPGGGQHRLEEWATVHTDASGKFVLAGGGWGSVLTIDGEGYARRSVRDVSSMPRPLRFELAWATPLHGRVAGLDGARATFFIARPEDDYRSVPDWITAYDWYGRPVEKDGTFSLPHLPKGKWTVRVDAPGVGTVSATPFEMPLQDELELQLTPARRLAVRAVDAAGKAVAAAEVLWFAGDYERPQFERPMALASQMFRHRGRDRARTDTTGKLDIAPPANVDVKLAVRAPGFMPTALGFLRDEMPSEVTVTLQQAGVVVGRLEDSALATHVNVEIVMASIRRGDRPGARGLVDAKGGFRVGPLLPGDYEVHLKLKDMTFFTKGSLVPSEPLPLIDDYEYLDTGMHVRVVGGEEVEILVPRPPLGEVRGRVLVGGRPVAGAIVFAKEVARKGQRGWLSADDTEIDAYQFAPNCRTDTLGRYRILVAAAKEIRVRARLETSDWSPPLAVDVTRQSSVDLPDIVLPSSVIRGRLDLTALDLKWRRLASAQLYPIGEAAKDPFFQSDWTSSLQWKVQRQRIHVTGEFAFESVAAGTWLLRLRTGRGRIDILREITITSDQIIDLGQLQPSPHVAPRLLAKLPETHGAWLRRVSAHNENGIFVATLPVLTEPGDLPALPAGRYLLQPFRRGPTYAGQLGTTGQADGKPVEFELHGDGTTSPAVLWPDGF